MILADDNFATIIKAVANGRNVYRNIKKCNTVFIIRKYGGDPVGTVHYPSWRFRSVAPVHLLFINLLTDSLPAIAIGMEPAEKELLSQKPRNSERGNIDKGIHDEADPAGAA